MAESNVTTSGITDEAPDEAHRQEVMRLVLAHRTQLLATLLALNRDPHRAEDLFQQTCLVVCAKWREFTPGTSFLAWARSIARFKHLSAHDPSRRREVAVAADVITAALDAATRAFGRNERAVGDPWPAPLGISSLAHD
jgi:RNA polymerase sigma-70 factor, ECF subfamily